MTSLASHPLHSAPATCLLLPQRYCSPHTLPLVILSGPWGLLTFIVPVMGKLSSIRGHFRLHLTLETLQCPVTPHTLTAPQDLPPPFVSCWRPSLTPSATGQPSPPSSLMDPSWLYLLP